MKRLAVATAALLVVLVHSSLAADPDLATPAMRALRTEQQAHCTELDKTRIADLVKMLTDSLANARQMQARAKVSGNITAIATAKAALKCYEDAQAALKQSGSFAFPEQVRRELTEMLATSRQRQQLIEEGHAAAVRKFNTELGDRFQELLVQQGTPVDDRDARQALFTRLLEGKGEPPPPPEPAVDTNAPPPEAALTQPGLPDVLDSNGESDQWLVVARVNIEVSALEVLSLPLYGISEPRKIESVGMESGRPCVINIAPVRELTQGDGKPLFRLRSVPGAHGADVASWPSARNNDQLEVRVRPDGATPSRHAFVLEVGGASAATRLLAGAVDEHAPATVANLIKVSFDSEPAGAFVSVDGKMLGANGRALQTPFEYKLEAAPQEVRFRKPGFLDAVVPGTRVKDGGKLQGTLQPDPNCVLEKVRVVADGKDWFASRLTVKPGQTVRLSATGKWSCGSDAEPIDAAGYPNNERFFKYYLDPVKHPRQLNGCNYGALLVKIGAAGKPQPVNAELTLRPEAEGELLFDINEGPGAPRRNNRGEVTVQVQILPGATAR